jgi:hypothetical protein
MIGTMEREVKRIDSRVGGSLSRIGADDPRIDWQVIAVINGRDRQRSS